MYILSTFLRNLILGFNDCFELLPQIQFKINSFNTRDPKPFYPIHSNRNNILNTEQPC